MLKYAVRRLLWMLLALLAFSFVAFSAGRLAAMYGGLLGNVPEELLNPEGIEPGQTYGIYYNGWHILIRAGTEEEVAQAEAFNEHFGLDKLFLVQYFLWLKNIFLHGDWGFSWEWAKPVQEILYERIALTAAIVIPSFLLNWLVALPLGTVLARKNGTLSSDLCTFFCRLLSNTPGFLIALLLMWYAKSAYDQNIGGLFSERYVLAPWSWGKVGDMLGNIRLPITILFIGGASYNTLVVRRKLLNERSQSYLLSGRARGVPAFKLAWRYPASQVWDEDDSDERSLPRMISSAVLVTIVLSLQTTGPMLLRACTSCDGYLAASLILLLGASSIIGIAFTDVLQAALDP